MTAQGLFTIRRHQRLQYQTANQKTTQIIGI